jgi:hypothetical protein
MKKTPLVLVKERFESKEKLVEAVQTLANAELWIDRLNEVKGLAKVSNAKLLRLHDLLTELKEKFGSRAKLIDAILDAEKRVKDAGFKSKLEAYPTPRLLDLWKAATRRAKRVAKAAAKKAAAAAKPGAKPAAAPKKKVARSKKAQAKARAA